MAAEIELKLEVPPAMLRALKTAPWLRRLGDRPVRQQKLVSVYFDTQGRALRDHGLALRVRTLGDRHVQTVKAGGELTRQEWEEDVADARPDRDLARHTALKPFADKKHWRKLKPVFETEVTRLTIPVKSGNSRIEVALDHGRVTGGGRHQPISEVELELKGGRVADLNGLAERILGRGKAALGLASKAERGYALADDVRGDPVGARDIALDTTMTAEDGFRAIAFSCLHHATANRDAVLKGDGEGIHQMRVGIRRLRACLSLFKPLIRGAEFEAVKRDLKWLSGELADGRDFDVFLEDGVAPLEDDAPAGLGALKSDLKARRRAGFAQARRLVRGDRYRRIILKVGLWLTGGDWATSDDQLHRDLRRRLLIHMARDILQQRTRKVEKKLARLHKLDAKGRHKLRIAVKKLRYGTGFFESLFGHAHLKKAFGTRLKHLQSALGKLNDIRVHGQFAAKTVKGRKQLPHGAYALGVLTGEEQATAKACLKDTAKAGARLCVCKRFWD